MVKFEIHDFGQIVCAGENHVKAFLGQHRGFSLDGNFHEAELKGQGENAEKHSSKESKPSSHSPGTPYVVQVQWDQAVQELRRVSAALGGADDGAVPWEG